MLKRLLKINQLSVSFAAAGKLSPALTHISIEVNKGEMLAIVGESGSGKSITSLSILQLLATPPAVYTSGSIDFTNNDQTVDLLKLPTKAISHIRGNKIAMIFQEPMTSLNPVFTCGFQVMEALQQHFKLSGSAAKKRTIELFKQVQLPDPETFLHRYPHEISGGQKQRVMIAMAMSCEPDLLICDEPTTALDVTVQKNILELIRGLQIEKNMGVIFITHDLGIVAEIADRVAVLYRGELIEEKATVRLFQNPEHAYTKALLACRPGLHPKGTRLPVVSDFMEINGDEIPAEPALSTLPHEIKKDSQPLLSVANLKVYFPTKKNIFGKPLAFTKAVDDISFDVYQGETLGLVGESGCGKSTLGRAIVQLIRASEGEIWYKGINLVQADAASLKKLRKEIQIIFQDPYSSLNPRMRIGNAIAEPLLVHQLAKNPADAREKVVALLQKVGLAPEHFNRYPHEFSGGQRQRIVIARALALKPSFIICDESVSALDVSVQAQVLNLLNQLKAEMGFTVIFISHDLSVVRYISDRILVMKKGRMVEIGDAEAIYNQPKDIYTQELIAAIPKSPKLEY
ncbi:MAG: ABC transporter ATP-binding protein [Sphingobacteriia bacterium]|nr:MAG: ABC transporter ATP-binding protein [Sphingobacteriia bacterium]